MCGAAGAPGDSAVAFHAFGAYIERQVIRQEARMEVEMKIRGLMIDPITNMPIVILKEAAGSKILPIWVGASEANAIALEIVKVSTPRPMTHDLLMYVLIGLDAQVN
jgi:bifunctional DNase/RNase